MAGMKISTNVFKNKITLESLVPGQVFMTRNAANSSIYMKLNNAESSKGIDGTNETVVNITYAELELLSTSQEVTPLESTLTLDK